MNCLSQKVESRLFSSPTCLVDQRQQPIQFSLDLSRSKQVCSGCQNCRFNDSELGTIETEKRSLYLRVYNPTIHTNTGLFF